MSKSSAVAEVYSIPEQTQMFSRSTPNPKSAPLVGLLAALICCAAAAWLLLATPSPPTDESPDAAPFKPFDGPATTAPGTTSRPAHQPIPSARALRAPRVSSRSIPPSLDRRAPTSPATLDAPPEGTPNVVIVKKHTTSSAPITLTQLPHAEPAGATGDPDGRSALDRRITGPARWMAQPDPATERAINEALRNSRAPAEVARQQHTKDAHLSARALIQQTAIRCARKLPPHPSGKPRTGQMAVTARLSASGTTATLQQVNAQPTYLLNTPEFHACFQGALTGATFPTSGDVPALMVKIPARVALADLR